MIYTISASSDIGQRQMNQDSLFVRKINASGQDVVLAVLCDGMGGFQKGELASSSLIAAFSDWMYTQLPVLLFTSLEDHVLREQWSGLVSHENSKIQAYAKRENCVMGSTVVAMLLTGRRYYILNIGDSRAYELAQCCRQLTIDHTVVEQEVSRGNMTQEQAFHSPHRNVLTRCVGVADTVYPDMFFGETKKDVVYLLCSDGFCNRITPDEMMFHFAGLNGGLRQKEELLIELVKLRGERDNISVVTIATS